MRIEDIEYTVGDRRMVGHLAVEEGRPGSRPGVLVCHEGPGLDEHAKGRAERLAGLGYAAFALDYHGEGKPLDRRGDDGSPGNADGRPRSDQRARPGRAVDLVGPGRGGPARMAAIGYCFGGTMALELARSGADLAVVVGFHSGLADPASGLSVVTSRRASWCASAPTIRSCPPSSGSAFEEEMRAAEVDWRMNLYGGAVHSFTNPNAGLTEIPGVAYHQPTDERSWRAMLDLFDERLGPV